MNATENPSASFTGPILRSLHIGVGNRGLWPLQYARAGQGFQPVGLCDLNDAALANARNLTGLKEDSCFQDFSQALARTQADCAIICAPTQFHLPLVKECVAAGLPVVVEKGMAPSWAEACELAAFVRSRKAKVVVAQNYRYRETERAIGEALANPASPYAIGFPSIVVYEQQRVRPSPNNLNYPFASVWDMSCHHFDTLLSWLGPIESLTAQAWGAPWSLYAHPNNTSAHIVFKNGSRVHYLHTHDASRPSLRVGLHGEKGALDWSDSGLVFSARPEKNFGQNPDQPIALHPLAGENGVLRDFYRYVVDGLEPGISVENNLEVMAACQMMVLSIQENRTVRREELP